MRNTPPGGWRGGRCDAPEAPGGAQSPDAGPPAPPPPALPGAGAGPRPGRREESQAGLGPGAEGSDPVMADRVSLPAVVSQPDMVTVSVDGHALEPKRRPGRPPGTTTKRGATP